MEAAGSTGEGHVEQVEVVDNVLQVLMVVVGLVDGARHAFLAVVDGYEGQLAEGRLLGVAPENVAALLFKLPVAEGNDDMIELQSL